MRLYDSNHYPDVAVDLYFDAWAAVVRHRLASGDMGYIPPNPLLNHEVDQTEFKWRRKSAGSIPAVQQRFLDVDRWLRDHELFRQVVLFAHDPDRIRIKALVYTFSDGSTVELPPDEPEPHRAVSRRPRFGRIDLEWREFERRQKGRSQCSFAASALGLFPGRITPVEVARWVYERARKEVWKQIARAEPRLKKVA